MRVLTDARGAKWVQILDAVPALALDLPEALRERARHELRLPLVRVEAGERLDGDWAARLRGSRTRPFEAVVVSGRVEMRRRIGDVTSLRLHGPGELLGLSNELDPENGPVPRSTAREATFLGILDERFLRSVSTYPTLVRGLLDLAMSQAARAERLALAGGLPRVEDRVLATLMLLAERWGRVTPAGLTLDLPMTHAELGEMIAAARPTVSLALKQLQADGDVDRARTGRWVMRNVLMAEEEPLRPHHVPRPRQPPAAAPSEPTPPRTPAENRARARRIREASQRLRAQLVINEQRADETVGAG